MEQFYVSVSISNSNGQQKNFEENYQGSLSSLINTLRLIKDKTNDYLTELVDEEKNTKNTANIYVENVNMEDSDIDLEDDYIDSELKKELLVEQSSSENLNESDKRRRTYKKSKKRVKY